MQSKIRLITILNPIHLFMLFFRKVVGISCCVREFTIRRAAPAFRAAFCISEKDARPNLPFILELQLLSVPVFFLSYYCSERRDSICYMS